MVRGRRRNNRADLNRMDGNDNTNWYQRNAWWIAPVGTIIAFVINLVIQGGASWLDGQGHHIGSIQFTTFEYSSFDNFKDYYYSNNTKTKTLFISNEWKTDLFPKINFTLEPDDNQIKITCKEQVTKQDCTKTFKIEGGGKSVGIDFQINIKKPKVNSYKLCIRTIDGRSDRSENYREECRNLAIKKL